MVRGGPIGGRPGLFVETALGASLTFAPDALFIVGAFTIGRWEMSRWLIIPEALPILVWAVSTPPSALGLLLEGRSYWAALVGDMFICPET